MLPALYTIASQYRALTDLDIENIDEQTILDTLEGLEGDLQTKATNVVAYQKNVQAFADMAAQAAKDMKARADIIQRRADGLKSYIKSCMEVGRITKLESPQLSVSIQKNPPSLVIEPDAEIPADFMVTPPAPEPYPNKTAIKDAIKTGLIIKGCYLKQDTRLVIK